MHANFGTALVVTAFLASLVLIRTDRMWALITVVVAGIEALMVFGILTLAVAKFRIDVILPALLLLSGAILWSKVGTKGAITAATIVTLVGAIQLLLALRVLS